MTVVRGLVPSAPVVPIRVCRRSGTKIKYKKLVVEERNIIKRTNQTCGTVTASGTLLTAKRRVLTVGNVC
jgi:hypothetical protein